MKNVAKKLADGLAVAVVFPSYLGFLLGALLLGRKQASPAGRRLSAFCQGRGRVLATGILQDGAAGVWGQRLPQFRDGLFAPHRAGGQVRLRGSVLLSGGRDPGRRCACRFAKQ
jgi:hypothetical protein